MTYRGAKVDTSSSPATKKETDDVPDEHKGKRKIIYRGQVKWVDYPRLIFCCLMHI